MNAAELEKRREDFENSLSLVGKCIVDGDGFDYEHANCTLRFEFNKLESGKEMCSVEITENKSTTMKDFVSPYDYQKIQKFIDDIIKTTPTEEPTYASVFQSSTKSEHDPPMPHSKNLRPDRGEERTREGSPSGGMGTPANLITDCIQCLAARVGLLESNHF